MVPVAAVILMSESLPVPVLQAILGNCLVIVFRGDPHADAEAFEGYRYAPKYYRHSYAGKLLPANRKEDSYLPEGTTLIHDDPVRRVAQEKQRRLRIQRQQRVLQRRHRLIGL